MSGGLRARIGAFSRSFLPDRRYRRFHPVYFIKFIQKYLIVFLLPLARALLVRDWAALLLALRQSAALLAAAALIGALEWRAAGWTLDAHGVLRLRSGLLLRRHRVMRGAELAALRIDRTPLLRCLGAGAVTLYDARTRRAGIPVLYLSRADCARLAEGLMPAAGAAPFYRAGRGERLPLLVLGVDTLTTGLFLWAAVRQTQDFGAWAERMALAGLGRLAQAAATWLPVGAAWLLTAAGTLLALSVGRSFCRTVYYRVYRNNEIVHSVGGLFHRFDCRVRLSCVCACDVRATPAARLLHIRPVYLIAGRFWGGDLPVMLCRPGQEAALRALLPGAILPPAGARADTKGRSMAAFLALPGLPAALLLVLAVLAMRLLPDLALAFFLAALAFVLMAAVNWDGRRRECVRPGPGCLTACTVRFFTLHSWYLPQPAARLDYTQSVWAWAVRRGSLTLRFAGGWSLKIKSIPEPEAQAVFAAHTAAASPK